jgi:hypothetical protein
MLCGQDTRIVLKILEILLMLCKCYIEDSANIRGWDCNIPWQCLGYIVNCNHFL